MAYLSSSSFVYIGMLGVPVAYFGLTFLPTVIGYMAGSGISARLSTYHESEQLMVYGTVAALTAAASMWALCSLFPDSVAAIMLPMMLYSAALGLILPHAMAIALRPFPHIAGTASSLLGFIQMSLSALASALVGGFLNQSPQPMVMAMCVASMLATVLALRAHKRYKKTKH
jgi:DHA1 family bicyclomycin/chloramphenicol resistance-like MFS transporter